MFNIKTISAAVIGAAAIGLGISVASAEAATITNPANGHRYTVITEVPSWTEAQTKAIGLGGNLVTINDLKEENWLKETFGEKGLFWIGFTDRETEGIWKWISGQSSTYTHWAAGEPSNSGGNENYAVMNWNWPTDGGWNDVINEKPIQAGIVEIESTPVPTPALLPGLIGMGVAALRKRKNDRSEAAEA